MIPTEFTLVNRDWKVRPLPKQIADEGHFYGDCNSETAVIRVLQSDEPDMTQHTYYHELVHALLEASSRPSLSTKEAFVDSLAAALHQYMKTKKGQLF